MADKRNLTIFQRLNRVFGKDGVNVPKDQVNRYNIGNSELIRTTDKAAFDQAKAQAKQADAEQATQQAQERRDRHDAETSFTGRGQAIAEGKF